MYAVPILPSLSLASTEKLGWRGRGERGVENPENTEKNGQNGQKYRKAVGPHLFLAAPELLHQLSGAAALLLKRPLHRVQPTLHPAGAPARRLPSHGSSGWGEGTPLHHELWHSLPFIIVVLYPSPRHSVFFEWFTCAIAQMNNTNGVHSPICAKAPQEFYFRKSASHCIPARNDGGCFRLLPCKVRQKGEQELNSHAVDQMAIELCGLRRGWWAFALNLRSALGGRGSRWRLLWGRNHVAGLDGGNGGRPNSNLTLEKPKANGTEGFAIPVWQPGFSGGERHQKKKEKEQSIVVGGATNLIQIILGVETFSLHKKSCNVATQLGSNGG